MQRPARPLHPTPSVRAPRSTLPAFPRSWATRRGRAPVRTLQVPARTAARASERQSSERAWVDPYHGRAPEPRFKAGNSRRSARGARRSRPSSSLRGRGTLHLRARTGTPSRHRRVPPRSSRLRRRAPRTTPPPGSSPPRCWGSPRCNGNRCPARSTSKTSRSWDSAFGWSRTTSSQRARRRTRS